MICKLDVDESDAIHVTVSCMTAAMRMVALAAASAAWMGCTPAESDWHRRSDDPRCLAVRGCAASRSVPPCGPSAATAVTNVASTAEGNVVELSGSLQTGEVRCSLAACPGHCCNTCDGAEALATGTSVVYLIGDGRQLHGDDSRLCFGTGFAHESVVARGTVRREDSRTLLVDAEVCAP